MSQSASYLRGYNYTPKNTLRGYNYVPGTTSYHRSVDNYNRQKSTEKTNTISKASDIIGKIISIVVFGAETPAY